MISVIIPTYNEAVFITNTIELLRDRDRHKYILEIIVCDGGSADKTVHLAELAGAKVISCAKGRSIQMNAGAALAAQPILYFLHADTLPPVGFTDEIVAAFQRGYSAGCFTLQFDYDHWFLNANAWFTRFNINAFRFGDQSLFVSKEVFKKAGGFNQNHIMLEDQDIISRIRKYGMFIVVNKPVITSSRKYESNGVYKTQAVYFLIYFLYRSGVSQQKLLRYYRKLIMQDKL